MTRHLIFTPQNVEKMRRLAAAGSTANEIADAIGASPVTVRRVAAREGILLTGTGNRFLSVEVEKDVALAYQTVARDLGIGPSALANEVLTIVARDGLFAAVLDAGDDEPPAPTP